MLEICENCERSIGRLETAHIHNGHIVCADCIRKLSRQPAEPSTEQRAGDDSSARHKILFQKAGVVVTATWIKGAANANVLIERVLTVKTTRGPFSSGLKVEVSDSAHNRHVYRFSDRSVATEFIGAIQKAKGSIIASC